MIDPMSAVIVGATLLAGFIAGRIHRPRRNSKSPRQPAATCECQHSLAMHNPTTGACAGTIEQELPRRSYDRPQNYTYVTCPCQQYVGPKPLALDFAQPYILPPIE